MTEPEFIAVVDECINHCLTTETEFTTQEKSEIIQKLFDTHRRLIKENRGESLRIFRHTLKHVCKAAAKAFCYNTEVQVKNLGLLERFFIIEREERLNYFREVERLDVK